MQPTQALLVTCVCGFLVRIYDLGVRGFEPASCGRCNRDLLEAVLLREELRRWKTN